MPLLGVYSMNLCSIGARVSVNLPSLNVSLSIFAGAVGELVWAAYSSFCECIQVVLWSSSMMFESNIMQMDVDLCICAGCRYYASGVVALQCRRRCRIYCSGDSSSRSGAQEAPRWVLVL
jgi:hypothetical protein